MVHKLVTWIAVADGAEARIFQNEGVGKGVFELSDRALASPRLRNRDIMADRPGRTFDRAGYGRHAMEPRTDPQEVAEHSFLRELVYWLAEQGQSGVFDRLVIIAEPRALGEIRRMMPKSLIEKLHGEISADLTHATAAQIQQRLEGLMAA